MEQFTEGESIREEIKNRLRQSFDGRIVRKDLTKKIDELANTLQVCLDSGAKNPQKSKIV